MALGGTYARCMVNYGTPRNENQVNVLWYRPSGTVTVPNGQAAADELAALMDTNINGPLLDCLAVDASYNGCGVEISIGGVVFTSFENGNAGNGNVSGVTSPEVVAAVIRKRTAQPGPSGRGRWFIGCVPESFTEIGLVTPTGDSAYEALGSAYRGDQVGVSVTWGSYMHSTKDDALYSISSTQAYTYVKRQSRRSLRPLFA